MQVEGTCNIQDRIKLCRPTWVISKNLNHWNELVLVWMSDTDNTVHVHWHSSFPLNISKGEFKALKCIPCVYYPLNIQFDTSLKLKANIYLLHKRELSKSSWRIIHLQHLTLGQNHHNSHAIITEPTLMWHILNKLQYNHIHGII